jgi:hypothetical protein
MRRATQLLRDLAAAKLKMEREREPKGNAENRRAEATLRLAQEAGSQENANGPNEPTATISALIPISEPTSFKRAMAGDERSCWTLATNQEIDSHKKWHLGADQSSTLDGSHRLIVEI